MPEKILVVDDDVDTLRLVGLMLQRQGYQIVAANNGHQALNLAQNENPDLIILDVMMPDMDGYEVTRRLRALATTKTTPIIMFTAKSQVDDKVSGFEAGVDDYLTKPTQPRELFAHVKAVLARSGKSRAAPSDTVKRDLGHVIGVLACKGGLGCSTLATNLAISLRLRTQQSVTLGELRPGEGSMALELGYLQPEGLGRLLQKRASDITSENVEAELVTHKSEIQILPASYRPNDARMNIPDRMEAIARHLAYTANFVILDLGPGISPSTDKILEICNELIVPLEPVSHIITRAQLLMDELIERGFGEGRLTAVLYTRSRSELNMALSNVQQQFKHPISLVFTAAPEAAFQAARSNIPMVLQQPDSLTSQQFLKLADLVTKHVRLKA